MSPLLRGKRSFPTRQELVENLSSELMYRWFQEGQAGCLFARLLAQDPRKAKWRSAVLRGVHQGEDLGGRLKPILEQASENGEALQILFPEAAMNSVEGVVALINDLCDDPAWYWEEVSLNKDDAKRHVLAGLRWRIPGSDCSSWVLGFADLKSMPFTRQSPFLALAMRTKPAPPDDDEPTRAHLAHMDSSLPQPQHDQTWAATENFKAELVGGENEYGARARVTFCLPRKAMKRLPAPGGP